MLESNTQKNRDNSNQAELFHHHKYIFFGTVLKSIYLQVSMWSIQVIQQACQVSLSLLNVEMMVASFLGIWGLSYKTPSTKSNFNSIQTRKKNSIRIWICQTLISFLSELFLIWAQDLYQLTHCYMTNWFYLQIEEKWRIRSKVFLSMQWEKMKKSCDEPNRANQAINLNQRFAAGKKRGFNWIYKSICWKAKLK